MSRTYDEKDPLCSQCAQSLVAKSERDSDCEYKGARQERWAVRRLRPGGGFDWATVAGDKLAWTASLIESVPFTAEATATVLASEAASSPERVPVDRAFMDEVFRLRKSAGFMDGVSVVVLDPDNPDESVRRMVASLGALFGDDAHYKH